jgi:hypothetical protein
MVLEVDALDRVFHLLASFPTPEEVLLLKAIEEESQRFDFLLDKNRESTLSVQETEELNKFVLAERYMRMAKAKALLAVHRKKAA